MDPVPDLFNAVSFSFAAEFHRAELPSGENPVAIIPFEVLV
jgi:hypothetical protein